MQMGSGRYRPSRSYSRPFSVGGFLTPRMRDLVLMAAGVPGVIALFLPIGENITVMPIEHYSFAAILRSIGGRLVQAEAIANPSH